MSEKDEQKEMKDVRIPDLFRRKKGCDFNLSGKNL
jgi:hypothetical protein